MAIDRRLQIYDEQGNLVDYDILASDVKFQPDGKDLPTKLAEMQDAIEDAGSGDGTVTGVKIGSTTYEPTDGVVDLSSPMASKVDKNGTDSLMTAAEHTKLAGIAAGAQVNVINSISVNNTPVTPTNGNVNISVEGGGSVESVTVSGTKYTPDTNGDINLGDLRGQDGNSGVASADGVESVNNLNGGTTDTQSKVYVLGANQGKRLRDQIDLIYQRVQTLYGLLGNIAFWDGKPSASALLPDLDWGAPKHAVAITNSLSNSVITRNGESVGSSFQAEEGSTVTLIVAPASGYALTAVSYTKDGGSSNNATSLSDGTYKIEFVMGGSDVTIAVSGTAQQAYGVTLNLTNCTKTSGPTSIINGGGGTFVFAANEGYTLPTAAPTVVGASIATDGWDSTTGTLVISGVSDNVTITIVATQTEQVTLTMKKVTAYGAAWDQTGNTSTNDGNVPMTLGNLDADTPECALSNTDYVDGQPFSATVTPASGHDIFSVKVEQNSQDITDDAYNPSTHAISVASADSSLAITVIVAAATNEMFADGSFFGCKLGNAQNFDTQKCGQIVDDTDWCCMSEFVEIPSGSTHIKWWLGDATHKPYQSNVTGAEPSQHRTCVFYDENFIPVKWVTYWDASKPYRDWDIETNVPTAKYVRASFKTSLLEYSKIEFSSDGTNFTTAWEYTED